MFHKVMSFLDAKQIWFPCQTTTIHPIIHLLNECAEANNSNPYYVTYRRPSMSLIITYLLKIELLWNPSHSQYLVRKLFIKYM